MTNMVLEGAFNNYKLSLRTECVFFERFDTPLTFGIFFKNEEFIATWSLREQLSSSECIVEINWNIENINKEDIKGIKIYNILINDGTTSTIIVDDGILEVLNKYFSDRRVDHLKEIQRKNKRIRLTNIVLEGAFKDYEINVIDGSVIRFDSPDNQLAQVISFKDVADHSIISWRFREQQSPIEYIIEIIWNIEDVKDTMEYNMNSDWKNKDHYVNLSKKMYNILMNDGTKSTVVVDDEIFGILNKYLFNKRTDLSEQEKQAILTEVRKQQTIEAMTRPVEKPAPTPTTVPDNTPRCPTCHSTNIRKIDGLERGASVFMLGLFSKKINKTFKCNNCGHTW